MLENVRELSKMTSNKDFPCHSMCSKVKNIPCSTATLDLKIRLGGGGDLQMKDEHSICMKRKKCNQHQFIR